MRHFAVSSIGRDRPGIVAAVTRVLLEHDLNIEDSSMTFLRGRFATTLVVSAPDDTEPSVVRADLEAIARELSLDAISLDEVAAARSGDALPTHTVTVSGADHPGIVHAVASALAGAGVNITDLNTRLVVGDAAQDDLTATMLEVTLPEGLSADALDTILEATRRGHGVRVAIRDLDTD